MLRRSCILAGTIWAVVSMGVAQGATVTYTLVVGQQNGGTTGVPGQWTLYADDSTGDNLGIESMTVGLFRVTTIFNDMPMLTYLDTLGPNPNVSAGFAQSVASNPPLYPLQAPLSGEMSTSAAQFVLISGFGQSPGTFPAASALGSGSQWNFTSGAIQTSWSGHLQIAHGSFNTAILPLFPDIDLSLTTARVLTSIPSSGNPVPTNSVTFAAAQSRVVVVDTFGPEPDSLLLMTLGIMVLLNRQSRGDRFRVRESVPLGGRDKNLPFVRAA